MVSTRALGYLFSLAPPAANLAPPLVLVDGTALVFRAYFAMPSMVRGPGGEVGALMGFLNTMSSMLVPAPMGLLGNPTVIVLFDASGPTFRDELCDQYKAQRSPPPADLGPQMELAREACRAFGWPAVAAPGFEGDDIIATMASVAKDRPVAIVASDKDFLQLVSDRVFVVCPTKKVLYSSLDVEAKWGVPPRLMADLQSLAGDSADNVKGIPGIGPKTASELLRQFGSLDAVLDNAGLVKQPKRRASLVAGRASALHARRLVTLKADVPPMSLVPQMQSDAELAALLAAPTPTNFVAAIAFCKRHELWQVAKNLEKHAKLA